MLSQPQLSAQIADLAAGNVSVEDFEQWFRRGSRNFHTQKDESLVSLVFEVENILTEYHFGDLDESAIAMVLAAAIRPFEKKNSPALFVDSPEWTFGNGYAPRRKQPTSELNNFYWSDQPSGRSAFTGVRCSANQTAPMEAAVKA